MTEYTPWILRKEGVLIGIVENLNSSPCHVDRLSVCGKDMCWARRGGSHW